MSKSQNNLFDNAMARYQEGEDANELINDFKKIISTAPNQSAGWTCLAWLQLLVNSPSEALFSARTAVKLNGQDPQARINLTIALLETNSKGVREQVDTIKRIIRSIPEYEKELTISINDGLERRPGWDSLTKIKSWLEL